MTMAPLSLLILALLSFNLQLNIIHALTNPSDHDFSYMKSVKDATDFPTEEEYDYIVVGGGTAGCPLAATLSKKYQILVIERGNVPQAHPNVLSAMGFVANLIEADSGDTPAQKFTSEDGVANVRGRVLGGTSMINGGYYSRANDDFFPSIKGVEWDMGLVNEAYEWVEETIVSRPTGFAIWQTTVRDGLLQARVGPNNEFTLDHKIGTKFSSSTFDALGRRHGAVELLNQGNLQNLSVAVCATVKKILFSRDKLNLSAIGVVYNDSNNKSHRALVRNKGEVILSAGALGSPQLLLLSGIGPDSELSRLGIRSLKSQPNVGQFMADNPRNNIDFVTPFPLQPSGVQVVGIAKEYIIESYSFDLTFSPNPSPFTLFAGQTSPVSDLSLAAISEKIMGPFSHGSLRLSSPNDATAAPHVRFNYFSNPKDLKRCVAGMRKVGDLLESKSLERFKYTDLSGNRGFMFLGLSLPANRSDNESMERFCRSSVTTFWHYHGGCLVGKVVDKDYKVLGVESLRVVDGSTFSTAPGTNPQATVMMLGRYMGVKILRERQS